MTRPSAQSRLLIVIPAWNEEEVLGDVLEMVKVEKPSFADILVVSDGSTDATADIARAAGVAVLDPSETTRISAKEGFSTFTISRTSPSTSSSFHAGITMSRRD